MNIKTNVIRADKLELYTNAVLVSPYISTIEYWTATASTRALEKFAISETK